VIIEVDNAKFTAALRQYAIAAGKTVDEATPGRVVNLLVKARNRATRASRAAIAGLRNEHKLWSWHAKFAAQRAGVQAEYDHRVIDIVKRKSKKRGVYYKAIRARARTKWYTKAQAKRVKRANLKRRSKHAGFMRLMFSALIDGIKGKGRTGSIHVDAQRRVLANGDTDNILRSFYKWAHHTTLARQIWDATSFDRRAQRYIDEAVPEAVRDMETYVAKKLLVAARKLQSVAGAA
jgi:hypothetical protein